MELTREHSGRVPELLYPIMVIAALAVIVFSVVGIASLTGWMPHAMLSGESAVALESTGSATPAALEPVSDVVRPSPAFKCAECGVVDSVRELEGRAVNAPALPYSAGI
jgi:outer membrane lipoprotein SlyB